MCDQQRIRKIQIKSLPLVLKDEEEEEYLGKFVLFLENN